MNERTNTPFKRIFFALSLIPLVIPIDPVHGRLDLPRESAASVSSTWSCRAGSVIDVRAGRHLFDGRDDLGRRPALLADGVPADDGGVSRDGSVAEESAHDERRQHLPGRAAVTIAADWPAIVATLLMLFVRAIESFEVPALLGLPAGIQVFTSAIYRRCIGIRARIGLASAYAVTLLVDHDGGRLLRVANSSQGIEVRDDDRQGFPAAPDRSRAVALARRRRLRRLLPAHRGAAIRRAALVVVPVVLRRCRRWRRSAT